MNYYKNIQVARVTYSTLDGSVEIELKVVGWRLWYVRWELNVRKELKELNPDMFKYLILYRNFQQKKAETRARILTKLEQVNKSLTLQTVAEEYQNIVNFYQDVKKLDEKLSQVQAYRAGRYKQENGKTKHMQRI